MNGSKMSLKRKLVCMYCKKDEVIRLRPIECSIDGQKIDVGFEFLDGSRIEAGNFPHGWRPYALDMRGWEIGQYTFDKKYLTLPNEVPEMMVCETCYNVKDILE